MIINIFYRTLMISGHDFCSCRVSHVFFCIWILNRHWKWFLDITVVLICYKTFSIWMLISHWDGLTIFPFPLYADAFIFLTQFKFEVKPWVWNVVPVNLQAQATTRSQVTKWGYANHFCHQTGCESLILLTRKFHTNHNILVPILSIFLLLAHLTH